MPSGDQGFEMVVPRAGQEARMDLSAWISPSVSAWARNDRQNMIAKLKWKRFIEA
jgi:hypothetical protein